MRWMAQDWTRAVLVAAIIAAGMHMAFGVARVAVRGGIEPAAYHGEDRSVWVDPRRTARGDAPQSRR